MKNSKKSGDESPQVKYYRCTLKNFTSIIVKGIISKKKNDGVVVLSTVKSYPIGHHSNEWNRKFFVKVKELNN